MATAISVAITTSANVKSMEFLNVWAICRHTGSSPRYEMPSYQL